MISICIPTYKRPQQLQTLLHTLLTAVAHPEPIEIVICDNDAGRSAEAVVDAASKTADVPVRYFNEPEQNISIARNRTIKEARGNWIAFIDDDEMPTAGWLAALHTTATQSLADGVFGPVIPHLPSNTAQWMIDMTADEQGAVAQLDGEILSLSAVATGNALVCANVLKKITGPFNLAFGTRGGEDTLAFGQLMHQHAAIFRACPSAVVFEDVPLYRCKLGWILRRSFRGGQAWVDIQGILFGRARTIYLVVRSFIFLFAMLAIAPVLVVIRRQRQIQFLKYLAALLGQFSVIFSYRYSEYYRST